MPGESPPFPVADHTLLRRVGKGAYGEVWLARNTLGTWRAVKFVRRSSFDDDKPFEREFAGIQRFEPISRSHGSQLNILHVGRAEVGFYYVMELADDMSGALPGNAGFPTGEFQPGGAQTGKSALQPDTYTPRNLRSELHLRGRLPAAECLRIGLALTTALEHLHKHGLVHRDIKPSNIVFVNGIPKLADIGLVARAEATMSFVGTEGFLPPEGPGTRHADIYSLGKVLYEISTGHDRHQFPELPTNVVELTDRAELSELNEVLLKACHRDPDQRYQTAAEMHADLALLESGRSVVRLHGMERRLRFVQRAGAIVTAVAALIAAGWWWQARQTRVVRNLAAENLTLAQRAETNATLAQKNEAAARESLYAADINLAYQALKSDNLRLARALLQNHRPQPGQPDPRGFEWRYLWEQCQSEELLSIKVHTNTSRVLAFAPDGQRIAVGAMNGITKVLDLQLRRAIASLPGTNPIHSLSFSPDGEILVIGSPTGIRIMEAQRFSELRRLPAAAAPGIFSPDQKFLLTGKPLSAADLESPGKAGQTLLVWDTTSWSVVRSANFPASGSPSIARDLYLQLAFGADSSRLAVLVGDTIRLLRFADLSEIAVLPDKIPIKQYSRPLIALSSDNRTLAIPGQQGFEVRLWDLNEMKELKVLTGHTDMVIAAAFSPDGTMLATCSPDQTTRLWNVATGELLNTLRGQADEVFDVAFSSDGKLLASLGCYDAMVKLWDPTRRPRHESFRDSLMPVGFEADGGLLAFRQPELDSVVVDPATSQVSPVGVPKLRKEASYGLFLNSVSSDGRFQTVWGRDQDADEDFVEVWDRREARRLCVLPAISPRVSFAPTRKLIATFTTNQLGEVSSAIWQLPAGTCKWMFTNIVKIAPDEAQLFTRTVGGELCFWTIDGDTVTPTLTISGAFGDAVFSPDGRLLAAFDPSGDIQIRSLPTGEVVGLLKGHTRKGTRLGFSPDGRTLASICDDRTIRLWHIATQRELLQFQSPDEDQGPFFLEFSPDGRALAATRHDNKGPLAWLYFAPSLAEIAVAEGGDYRAAAGDNPTTWLAVAKALVRKERWQEAREAFDEVLIRTANRDDLAWLHTIALRQRVEVVKQLSAIGDNPPLSR
ncbi:MAG: protein kinase [Verrucomicrobia bacterium]|nr:protein kinase [Verrucomicrobiota bacterium]